MNAKTVTILLVFIILLIFSVVSRIFFNDFQEGWNAYEKKDYKTARELWLPLAEQGETRAQFFMGFMHDMGFGVPEDDQEALKWYKIAAEQGDSRAQLFTGYSYDFGNGAPEDDQEALKWYRLAFEQGVKQAKINIYNLAEKNSPEALKILRADAENGGVKAQYFLAMMHDFGQGVSQDGKEAFKWYQLASEQGNAKAKAAIYSLAKKNIPEALKILRADAENGNFKAQYTLGAMRDFGQGVQQDHQKAVKWYQLVREQEDTKRRVNAKAKAKAKAAIYGLAKKNSPEALKILINDAENDNAVAQSTLSMMYQLGLGVLQDNHEAVKWFGFAAERELSRAKKEMIGFKRQNIPQALKALSNDAENGSAKSQLNLGMMLQLGLLFPKDDERAAKWYRLLAEQGGSNAQSIMGLMYANGQGVPQDDGEALKWYRLAAKGSIAQEKARVYELAKQNVPQALKILTDDADNGIAEAQMNLGMMLRFGLGVPKDEKEAAKWYLLAAEQGGANAQSIMGLLYANGQGVSQDNGEAMKWAMLAAEKSVSTEKIGIYNLAKLNAPKALKVLIVDAESGVMEAQYYLGEMHVNGLGVPYDSVLAHMWYNLSALQGHENATGQIISLEKRMSPQQIEQAQEMVRDWKPRE